MLVLATMELVAHDMHAYEMHAILAPGTRKMLIPEQCWHQSEGSNCQNPHPLGGAYIGEFERADTSPLTIQLLVHLGISTASDLTLRIALYVLLKLAVVPGLCTVVDAQELDESVLIRLAHYHRKPLPKRKPLQPSLARSGRLKNLSSGGKPEK